MGTGAAEPIPFTEQMAGNTVLAASDGLLKYTSMEKIRAVVSKEADMDAAAGKLVDLVRLKSGALQDDVVPGDSRIDARGPVERANSRVHTVRA